MGQTFPKDCRWLGIGDKDNIIDLEKLNKFNTIPNNFLVINPPEVELNIIESYDHQKNFFISINNIKKLQRIIKKWLKERKLSTLVKSASYKPSPTLSRKSSKSSYFGKVYQSNEKVQSINLKPITPIKSAIITLESLNDRRSSKFLSKDSICLSYCNSILSYEQEVESGIKGYFLLKKEKNKYRGGLKDGLKNGIGILEWEDGSCFRGLFVLNKAKGYGNFKDNEGSVFAGEYENNRPKGWGIYQNLRGPLFEGFWQGNKQSILGYETWPDETYYQGEYKEGKKHGIGTYKWPDGTIYEGEWENNSISGNGIMYFLDDRIYMGQFNNGLLDGYGEFLWPDGKKYFGYYKDDNKHGFGIFVWSTNPLKAYIGFWKDGRQHGIGIMINSNTVKHGLWSEGKKELFFKSTWDMKKHATSEQLIYMKFLQKDISYIVDFFLI